jgi:hypothetical protein
VRSELLPMMMPMRALTPAFAFLSTAIVMLHVPNWIPAFAGMTKGGSIDARSTVIPAKGFYRHSREGALPSFPRSGSIVIPAKRFYHHSRERALSSSREAALPSFPRSFSIVIPRSGSTVIPSKGLYRHSREGGNPVVVRRLRAQPS